MTKLEAILAEIAREYGRDPDPCPFCGGMVGRRGHLLLTREDGKTTRCQVGDVRELARTLEAQAESHEKDAAMVAGVMADVARDRETLERRLAFQDAAVAAATGFAFCDAADTMWFASRVGKEGEPGAWRILRKRKDDPAYVPTLVAAEENVADALWATVGLRDKANAAFRAETRELSPLEVELLRTAMPDAPDDNRRTSPEDAEALARLTKDGLLESGGMVANKQGFQCHRLVTSESGKRALARVEGKS